MTIRGYLRDRTAAILLNLAGMAALSLFLTAGGTEGGMVGLILIGWAAAAAAYFICAYLSRRRYFKELEGILSGLDRPYLLGELIKRPYRCEDQIYACLLKESNKSVIEEIHLLEAEQKDYREYIESWVHDAKIPVTAIELICDNQTGACEKALARKIRPELGKIENYIESALFYARSDFVYQDYLMKELDLQEVVYQAIAKNKAFLIQNGMRITVRTECGTVFCDEKWLIFILSQILINAAKYKKGEKGTIRVDAEDIKNGVQLAISDEGVGIRREELVRIFDKGFTGTNGRGSRASTGMGLYLCGKLCEKLGIQIHAESEEGKGMKMILRFPKGTFYERPEPVKSEENSRKRSLSKL